MVSLADGGKRRVSYFYEPMIGDYYYGVNQPTKPQRIRVTHNLILSYNLHRHMEINHPDLADASDFEKFHSLEYINFLKSVTPETVTDPHPSVSENLKRFNVDVDWDGPVFHNLFDYCRAYAGGSISAAAKLNRQEADIAINWAGGMHHVKKDKASGFGYVNDVVLAILELLKSFKRVLYIEIGFPHGDEVEEAFKDTDRVMTVSFHKVGDTGDISDYGEGKGQYYSLNAPLKDGLDDFSLRGLFIPVIHRAMEIYEPEVIVLQCGADSLAGDPFGTFNLSIKGHGDCLQYVRSFNVPLMILGGGGYTLPNVARCWCYETAIAVGEQLDNDLPGNDYMKYFRPDYKLHILPTNRQNLNTRLDIITMRETLLAQLSLVMHAPSVPFQATPSSSQATEAAEVDMEKRNDPRI
ncbi:Ureohydrolase domain superfamily [Arabidopsis suecica]|uniref:Histone deacetylase n=1 Tax=Arabidopsis suecica TaxID=45249 RepID=A0A8T2DHF7_ARASU|nr:Ureohydrolase domain superfamily [Arabidopsis suecica]